MAQHSRYVLGILLFLVLHATCEEIANNLRVRDKELMTIFNNTINAPPGKRLTKLLNHILKDYDKQVRPFYGEKPLNVSMDVHVISFGEIKEANMQYVVDIYLGQFWYDHRFALGLDQNYTMEAEFTKLIWTPDTFVINAVKTQIHKLTKENQQIFMNLKNGLTMHTCRLRLIVSCRMNLRNYPKDKQICFLPFESYTYEEFDIAYTWLQNDSITIYDNEMAQFTLESVKRSNKHPKYHSPTFSGLTVTFVFQRRWIYYVYQVYVPCICITVLSWIGFWIDHKAVPARTGLGITTVLTMVYMLASVNSNLPRVTYLKSIDHFVLGCFGFIFLTLIEYVLAIRFSRSRKRSNEKARAKKEIDESATLEDNHTTVLSFQEKPPSYECNGHAPVNGCAKPRTPLVRADSAKSNSLVYSHVVKPRRQASNGLSKTTRNRASPLHRVVTKVSNHENIVDMISRVVFPLAFVIFNIIYWLDFVKM